MELSFLYIFFRETLVCFYLVFMSRRSYTPRSSLAVFAPEYALGTISDITSIQSLKVNMQNLKRFVLAPLVVTASLVLCASFARAQGYSSVGGMRFNNIYGANLDTMMTHMIQRKGWDKVRSKIENSPMQPQAASVGTVAGPSNLPLTATDFKPAGPRNIPEMLAANATSPQQRQQIIDLARLMHKTLESADGFRRNNLAYAMTTLLGIAFQVHSGRELSDAESETMLHQINDMLGDLPMFKAMPADKRTQMYDGFIVIAGFIISMAQEGAQSGNAQTMQAAKTLARDALAQFGLKVS